MHVRMYTTVLCMKECAEQAMKSKLGWGSYSLVNGEEAFCSSEIMSKEVNKVFDKELGKYNTLLIYNCHHCL